MLLYVQNAVLLVSKPLARVIPTQSPHQVNRVPGQQERHSLLSVCMGKLWKMSPANVWRKVDLIEAAQNIVIHLHGVWGGEWRPGKQCQYIRSYETSLILRSSEQLVHEYSQ